MPSRLVHSVGFAVIGMLLAVYYVASSAPPSFLVSSTLIVVLMALVILRHGLVSVPAVVISAGFVPSLAFLWAWINGASYINMMNQWLQNDQLYVNSAVYLVAIALCFTVATLFAVSATRLKRVEIIGRGQVLSRGLYALSCLGTLFFVWLTEPTFSTILTAGSTIVKTGNFEDTQFAGALAVIFWLPALLSYASSRWRAGTSHRSAVKTMDRLFVGTTLISVAWLVLHARRNELIGMGAILLLVLQETKGTRRAVILGGLFVAVLFVLGQLRTFGLRVYIGAFGEIGATENVASLPGGASNVFLTFVDTIHYFDTHALLLGQTFVNYILQIAPSFYYEFLSLERPPHFFQSIVAPNYEYNGGTYAGALFFGNFGIFGMVLFGICVGLFIITSVNAIASRNMGVRLIGLYMVAFTFRGFWYEMITLIKPIAVVLLPACLLFAVFLRRKSRAR